MARSTETVTAAVPTRQRRSSSPTSAPRWRGSRLLSSPVSSCSSSSSLGAIVPQIRRARASSHLSEASGATTPRRSAELAPPRHRRHRPRPLLVRTLYGLHTSEQSALRATAARDGHRRRYRRHCGLPRWLARRAAHAPLRPDRRLSRALLSASPAYTYFTPVTVTKATIILALLPLDPGGASRASRDLLASRARVRPGGALARSLGPSASSSVTCCRTRAARIIIAATTLLGQVIMLEATIEFFGLGVPTADSGDAREPDRRRPARRPHAGRGLVGVGRPGDRARRDPRLRQPPRRRHRRGPPPAEAALAGTRAEVGRSPRRPSRELSSRRTLPPHADGACGLAPTAQPVWINRLGPTTTMRRAGIRPAC